MLKRFLESKVWRRIGDILRVKSIGEIFGWWKAPVWAKAVPVIGTAVTCIISWILRAPSWFYPLEVIIGLVGLAILIWIVEKFVGSRSVVDGIDTHNGSRERLKIPRSAYLIAAFGFGIAALLVIGWREIDNDCYRLRWPSQLRSDATEIDKSLDSKRSALGKQVGCLLPLKLASESFYENAISIWIDDPRTFFVTVTGVDKWQSIKERDGCPSSPEYKWCYDLGKGNGVGRDAAKKHFRRGDPPQGKFYPYGGIAWYISNNPAEWNKFRWLERHCELDGNVTLLGKFERGFVIGPVPSVSGNSQAVFFYSDKSFDSALLANRPAPACSESQTHGFTPPWNDWQKITPLSPESTTHEN